MGDEAVPLTDTSDMYAIHNAFRRALGDVPPLVERVESGDVARAAVLAAYLDEVLWLLEKHHEGEDELLYPLLVERAPEHADLYARMEAQHAAVKDSLATARSATRLFAQSATRADGDALSDAALSLLHALAPHLDDEEVNLLPVAAAHVSPEEWGALPGHAMSQYSGERLWLPFGLVVEQVPTDHRDAWLSTLPPPVRQMWSGGGAEAFARTMAEIRTPDGGT